jgi:hypothetical protein
MAFTLVENGQPRAVIVASKQFALAAQIFRDHIKQISGADLPIQQASTVRDDQPRVLIGSSKQTMLLRAKGNTLTLSGTDDGAHYAVVTFLEDKLGVRWLWPGELGKVVPRRDTIHIEDFETTFTPSLVQRKIRDSRLNDRLETGLKNLRFTPDDYKRQRAAAERTTSTSGDCFSWQKPGGSFNVSGGHAFGQLWEKYGKEHPDWFALQPNGARARLCKSNPELIAAIAREKIEELNTHPNLGSVSLSPNDGSVNRFCACPKCEALDAPNGRKVKIHDADHVSLINRMVYFWNAIAEQVTKIHPNTLFTVDAYSAYRSPPVLRKLHPNLVVRFVQIQYTDETLRQQSLRDWDEWAKAAPVSATSRTQSAATSTGWRRSPTTSPPTAPRSTPSRLPHLRRKCSPNCVTSSPSS